MQFWDTADLKFHDLKGIAIFDYAYTNIFQSAFRDMVDLKTLQSDWLPALVHISETRLFPKWDFCRNIGNNTNFHYRPDGKKIIDQTFQHILKSLFMAYFPHFGGKKIYRKIWLSQAQLHMDF